MIEDFGKFVKPISAVHEDLGESLLRQSNRSYADEAELVEQAKVMRGHEEWDSTVGLNRSALLTSVLLERKFKLPCS